MEEGQAFPTGGTFRTVLRLAAVLAAIAAITFICFRWVSVNSTTVGFAYLVAVLLIASAWGLLEATVASVVAVLCFNYFFLPPIGTFTIADPQNWVALFSFLATSIVASQLSARAKRQTQEAKDRQRDMERLYALGRAILLIEATEAAPKQMAHHIARIFGLPAVVLFDRSTGEAHRGGPQDLPSIEDKLRQAALQGTLFHDEVGQTTVTSIHLGGQPIGSLAIRGPTPSDTALQALSNLVAIGLEKVRVQQASSRAEAARQSEELKSTLLDAIAHEFKTPLTSIKAAASALLSDAIPKAEGRRELVTIVNEEADRLSRLVTEAIQMARIEAGRIRLNKGLHPVQDLVSRVLEQVKPMMGGRAVDVRLAADLPKINVDAELMELAIRQVIDNALKYSPAGSPVSIGGERQGESLILRVRDQGPGIPEGAQARIFEKYYRGPTQVTGTGMGLAIAREIARAHGGDMGVRSSVGQGSEFFISIPLAAQEETA